MSTAYRLQIPWKVETTMLASRLDCSTAPREVLFISQLVELQMLDLGDLLRTGISILASAAEQEAGDLIC